MLAQSDVDQETLAAIEDVTVCQMSFARVRMFGPDDPSEAMDSHSQGLCRIGETVLDVASGQWHSACENVLAHPAGDLLVIDRVLLEPAWRGLRLGPSGRRRHPPSLQRLRRSGLRIRLRRRPRDDRGPAPLSWAAYGPPSASSPSAMGSTSSTAICSAPKTCWQSASRSSQPCALLGARPAPYPKDHLPAHISGADGSAPPTNGGAHRRRTGVAGPIRSAHTARPSLSGDGATDRAGAAAPVRPPHADHPVHRARRGTLLRVRRRALPPHLHQPRHAAHWGHISAGSINTSRTTSARCSCAGSTSTGTRSTEPPTSR